MKDDDDLSQSNDTTADIATVGERPVADAGGPYSGSVGVAVQFSGADSTDDGQIVSYDWDFGDNSPNGTGVAPVHTYDASGTYTVKLTVTDDDGETDTDPVDANIATGGTSPTADAGGPYIGEVGVAVRFDGTGSIGGSGSIISYEWDFGDFTTGIGAAPLHTYTTPGSYGVNLTVTTDDDAVSAAGATVIVVDEVPLRPATDIIGLPDVNGNGTPDVAVLFSADGSNLVQIREGGGGGSGGQLIRELNYGDTLTLAIGAVERDGFGPAIAVMRQFDDGEVQVQVRDAAAATLVTTLSFGTAYSGVDLAILPDINGNGVDEAVVVGEDASRAVRIQARDISTGEKLGTVFHGAGVNPIALRPMPDLNGDGAGEIALLERVRSNGKFRVWVIDMVGEAVLNDIDYGFGDFEALGMAVVPAAAAADTGVAVLSNRATDNTGKIVTKNALTGANISNFSWVKNFVPIDLETVADTNSNGTFDLALMELDAANGDVRVRVFDSGNGAQTNSMPLQQLASAIALAALDDVNGNGSSEVTGLGAGGQFLRIHGKDSVDQSTTVIADLP